MTIADQRLTSALDALLDMQISAACFLETGNGAPSELRLHFSGNDVCDGVIGARDDTGGRLFSADMRQIVAAVPCFTPTTEIMTGTGISTVGDLRVGQQVLTRDSGLQTIRWIGRRRFGWRALALNPLLRPVRIAAGALGPGLPARDMTVSPNHRILIARGDGDEAVERLVAAGDLAGQLGVTTSGSATVEYVQILLDRHELVLADGCWSESFEPSPAALAGLSEGDRASLVQVIGAMPHSAWAEQYNMV